MIDKDNGLFILPRILGLKRKVEPLDIECILLSRAVEICTKIYFPTSHHGDALSLRYKLR